MGEESVKEAELMDSQPPDWPASHMPARTRARLKARVIRLFRSHTTRGAGWMFPPSARGGMV